VGRTHSKKKQLIPLDQWRPILSVTEVKYVNLQYGDCTAEITSIRERHGLTIHDWDDADPLKDLDSHAAQIAALDLVIATDNAAVHMAGALGVPVWVIISKAPNWRWMTEREDSPWYPSVRLFRQKAFGNWEDVIMRITAEMTRLSRHAGESPRDHGLAESRAKQPLPILMREDGS